VFEHKYLGKHNQNYKLFSASGISTANIILANSRIKRIGITKNKLE